jgi:hypothetical protein
VSNNSSAGKYPSKSFQTSSPRSHQQALQSPYYLTALPVEQIGFTKEVFENSVRRGKPSARTKKIREFPDQIGDLAGLLFR